ncbi:MAG: saccharopine dehydrogenase NADP-binding domain-containing protein [Bacteroidetes bacterium]|nr:saccharopine dehydrogenase NADP-binding domain-containing protein [Bacteroidota bacterium]
MTFSIDLLTRLGDVRDILGSFLDEQIASLEDTESALVIMKTNSMKKILILGAGRVVEPMIGYFLDKCKYTVTLADMDYDRAATVIGNHPGGKAVQWHTDDKSKLHLLVSEADIVISMLPWQLHVPVAEACVQNKKSMVTTSYVQPGMARLHDDAMKNNVLLLNECGEDPGLDHVINKYLIDLIHKDGGEILSVASYGSGIPAARYKDCNPFRYKVSWSPLGLILAGNTPAVYLRNGNPVFVTGEGLYKHTHQVEIANTGIFEAYPNRDCRRYTELYGLSSRISLFRGLLRYPGWCILMNSLKKLGWYNTEEKRRFEGRTLREVTAVLSGLTDNDDLEEQVVEKFSSSEGTRIIAALGWLGLFGSEPVTLDEGTPADLLACLFAQKMQYRPEEQDMALVYSKITAIIGQETKEYSATIVCTGIPGGHSAMSRCVSLPAAISARRILEGKINARGVRIPNIKEIYLPVLNEMKESGISVSV